MAPGWLRFNKIDVGEYVGPSGLVEIRKDKFSRTKYGRVIACGAYQDRTGKIHEAVDQWPLPLNTVIEIRNHDPWENHDGTLTVPTYDVVGYWLPGTEPDFLKE